MTVTSIEDLAPQPPPASPDAVANIFNMLRRRRYAIAAFVMLCMAVAGLLTAHLKPLYKVELTLLIDPHSEQVNDIQTLATPSRFVDISLVRNEIAILWSEDLIRQVVTKLDLQDEPDFQIGASRFFENLSPDNPLDRPLIAVRDFGKRALGFVTQSAAETTSNDKINAAIIRYLGLMSVINDGHSYVVTLRINASDPALAVKIVNAHARAYLENRVALKATSVREANAAVTAELDTLATKLKSSEEDLRSFRDHSALIGPDSPSVISQKIADLTSKLITVRSQISDKEASLRAVQHLLNDQAAGDAGGLVTSPAYDRLRAKEQDLLQQQAETQATFGDAYPKVAEIRRQVATTQGLLREEAGRMVKSAAIELSGVRSQESELVAALQSSKAGVQQQDAATPSLHFLEAEVEANRTVYAAFLTRVRQLAAQVTLQQPDGRIIGEAILPTLPYFPNRPLVLAAALFGSSAIAVLLALLAGFMSPGFDTLGQVERVCDAPGLGIVPLLRKRGPRRGVRLLDQIRGLPGSHYAERVRLIRNSLALTTDLQQRGQVILVTSSLPAEGKTSCAVSLAMSAAASRKTLLIDADFRHPAVGVLLGADPGRPGLGDFIEAKAAIDDVIQVHAPSGLHYIPARRMSQANQESFNFDGTIEFFEALRSRYDYVFVDSPPLIAVSDAMWLAHAADSTLFLVRWRRTPRSAARAAIQKLRDTGTLVAGVLLTFVDINRSGSLTPNDFDYYLKNVRSYYDDR